jgi:ABC-type multidrug transport system fused ATPase/permease subunit
LKLLSAIWGVLTSQQKRLVLWTQLLSVLMAVSTVAGIAFIAPFFAVLGDPHLIEQISPLRWIYHWLGFAGTRSFEIALGVAFVAAVVIANLINVVGSLLMIRLSYRISAEFQSVLLEEYLSRPYLFHTKTNSAVLCNNILNETNRVTNDVLQSAFPLFTNLITSTLILVSVALVNPAIAALLLCALAGGYVLIYLSVRNYLARSGHVQSHRLVEQNKAITESLAGIKEIIVLRIQGFFRAQFEHSSRALAHTAANGKVINQMPKYFMECVTVGSLVLVALFISSGTAGLGAWLGQLSFIGFAAYRLLPILQQVYASVVRIRSEQAGFANIEPDLRLARAALRNSHFAHAGWEDRPANDICFRDVSFRYQPDRPAAISNATLRIPAGSAVGLVGANGSGKTTLVDLLAGLLSPDAGTIEVDGVALDESNRHAWQSRIAYVPQSIFLVDATIAENIALGVRKQDIDRDRLIRAAEMAHLKDFIGSLPDGFGHRVGERGIQLSGGQRQRIGVARALYTNAPVLLLDEATSALDGLTEHQMMDTIMKLRGHKTIVLIAHRMGSVRACDLIFEFDRGRVTGGNSYAKLVGASESFMQLTAAST